MSFGPLGPGHDLYAGLGREADLIPGLPLPLPDVSSFHRQGSGRPFLSKRVFEKPRRLSPR